MKPSTDRRAVLVTGAGGGLGRALTAAFLRADWRVTAAGHTSRPPGNHDHLWTCQLDVRNAAAVEEVVNQAVERWGRLDALVCNAGLARDRLLAQLDDATWNDALEVNLKGAFLCARAAADRMRPRHSGHILLVASHAARTGAAGQCHYAAAKAGLLGLTLSLARELGPDGICVNAVLPGVMPTAMTASLPPSVLAGFAAASVLGRINDPDEVARDIVHLAGLRHVSGQIVALDGRILPWA